MKRSDIADGHVLDLARRWREGVGEPGVVAVLVAEGVPEKVAVAKVLHMVRRRLLDYGVSPYYAWPVLRGLSRDLRDVTTCGFYTTRYGGRSGPRVELGPPTT